jgi:DNA-binding response OmpR family regulator
MPNTVLFVETEEPFARDACAALQGAGFDVVCARDANEALDILETRAFSLLIARIEFPKGQPHGFALGRMARYRRATAHVILLSGPDEDLGEAQRDGLILRKPLSPERLVGEAMLVLRSEAR